MPFEVVLGGIVTVVTSVVAAGAKGLWVWGRELMKAEKEATFWRDIALRGMELTDAALSVVTKKPNGP